MTDIEVKETLETVDKWADEKTDKEAYREYLQSQHWLETRQARLALDGYQCAVCKAADNLRVHHLTYDRLGEERVEEDLITLCDECHAAMHRTIDGCADDAANNTRWYRKKLYEICAQTSDEYTDRQARAIAHELVKLDGKQWNNIQAFMRVFRNSVKIDKQKVVLPGNVTYGGTMLHNEAIKAGSALRKAKKATTPLRGEKGAL